MKSHTIYVGFLDSHVGYWDQDRQWAEKKRAWREHRIGWESLGSEEFSVDFGKKWPFEGNPQVLASTGGLIAPLKVSKQAEEGIHYPYTVAKQFSSAAADPEIIIDPQG